MLSPEWKDRVDHWIYKLSEEYIFVCVCIYFSKIFFLLFKDIII